jgi:hypothetical protein
MSASCRCRDDLRDVLGSAMRRRGVRPGRCRDVRLRPGAGLREILVGRWAELGSLGAAAAWASGRERASAERRAWPRLLRGRMCLRPRDVCRWESLTESWLVGARPGLLAVRRRVSPRWELQREARRDERRRGRALLELKLADARAAAGAVLSARRRPVGQPRASRRRVQLGRQQEQLGELQEPEARPRASRRAGISRQSPWLAFRLRRRLRLLRVTGNACGLAPRDRDRESSSASSFR